MQRNINKKTIKLKSLEKELDKLYKFIINFLKAHNITNDTIENIIIASTEVVSNIIKHNYKYNKKKFIDIIIEIKNSDKIFVTIKDTGFPFDPTKFFIKSTVKNLNEIKKAGYLGLFLIKKLSNDIKYTYKNGNIITLIF